jgi:5-formyltetrahydrofolate cyclo-ligase
MLQDEKARLRQEMLERRLAVPDRDRRSAEIHARVMALPYWGPAAVVSSFVGVKAEVATTPLIAAALAAGKRVAVPVVEGGRLQLYRIESLDELQPAPFGLLEPPKELRRKHRRVVSTTVSLYIVPGLAFDKAGGRLGYGKGYYDTLLSGTKPVVPKVGVGFEAQIVPVVPMGPTDVRLPIIVTEAETYLCAPIPERRPKR